MMQFDSEAKCPQGKGAPAGDGTSGMVRPAEGMPIERHPPPKSETSKQEHRFYSTAPYETEPPTGLLSPGAIQAGSSLPQCCDASANTCSAVQCEGSRQRGRMRFWVGHVLGSRWKCPLRCATSSAGSPGALRSGFQLQTLIAWSCQDTMVTLDVPGAGLTMRLPGQAQMRTSA